MTGSSFGFRIVFSVGAMLAAASCATSSREAGAVPAETAVPAAPVYALSDLLGASGGEVDTLLGAPALVRREGEGEYRRYGLRTCALILILYPDEMGAATVRHVDAAALRSDEEKPDLSACLAAG